MAVTVIVIVSLRIAVVEAAGAVVMGPVEDIVYALRVIARGYACGLIVTVTGAGRNVDTVCFLTIERDLDQVAKISR